MGQKFCYILVTWDTIWQLQMFLLRSWRWQVCLILARFSWFLDLSGYFTEINCVFTFATTIIFGYLNSVMVQFKVENISSWIRWCMFISVAFKSHEEWSNSQHVSTPTTTILPTTAIVTNWTVVRMGEQYLIQKCESISSPQTRFLIISQLLILDPA